jgi:hypothetical protein
MRVRFGDLIMAPPFVTSIIYRYVGPIKRIVQEWNTLCRAASQRISKLLDRKWLSGPAWGNRSASCHVRSNFET